MSFPVSMFAGENPLEMHRERVKDHEVSIWKIIDDLQQTNELYTHREREISSLRLP